VCRSGGSSSPATTRTAVGECYTCMAPVITPRTALLLHAAAEILSDEVSGAMGDLDIWDLPPFVKHLSPAALEQFRTAFLALATDLAHGAESHPRTNAEEIALHLMIDRANVVLELGSFDDELERLPESAADYDWEGILGDLFQDDDYTGLMAHRGKLPAKEVASLFERFHNMPARPYATNP
jgi:hypothetical protein